ncbi:uncharacterized protein K444DRAFT_613570 [Hyaloscypha bicolor E]|uniref:Uncharacterized protein n=1 Tax=Hyaloscypha bicolor E TaxID=1095630 RepID=A0A2J6T6Q4_9HELO|nr:uncharacterized protein K444DRAFT_613570 [Hyaloscypha bicolor E]PMD58702.1 hypothetical protein K444DRAFT_613570 [Hyaloscypha bicolor E]
MEERRGLKHRGFNEEGQKRSKSPRELAKEGVLCRHFNTLGGRASLLDLLTSKVFMKS